MIISRTPFFLYKALTRFSTIPLHKSSALSVLGLRGDPSFQEVKKAYFQLSKRFHPDVSQSSGEKFKEICLAYQILKQMMIMDDDHQFTFLRSSHFNIYDVPLSDEDRAAFDRNKRKFSDDNQETLSLNVQEEIIYKRIFGKSYKDDPNYFYAEKNRALREKFEAEMENQVEKEQFSVTKDEQKNAFFRAHEHCKRHSKGEHETEETKKRMERMFKH